VKIVIPGGSGQIGSLLARAFAGDGHDVVFLGHPTWPEAARDLCEQWRH
jgi:NAD(P)-dependent dehydrogenase (short-subunit alcohol dehydrogenase family)